LRISRRFVPRTRVRKPPPSRAEWEANLKKLVKGQVVKLKSGEQVRVDRIVPLTFTVEATMVTKQHGLNTKSLPYHVAAFDL
jgi:hypothetical protein